MSRKIGLNNYSFMYLAIVYNSKILEINDDKFRISYGF